jgi:PAP2 superfamily
MPAHAHLQIELDRLLGFGSVPTVWLQDHLWHGAAHLQWYDYATWAVYMSYFFATTLLLAALWWWRPAEYRRFAAMVVGLAVAGCATYVLYPADPPWLAAQNGDISPVHRFVGDVNLDVGTLSFTSLWESGQRYGNDVAAVPSLHAAYTLLLVLFLVGRTRSRLRHLLWLYPAAMAFALVYAGEHYVCEILLGWLYATAVYVIAGRSWGRFGRRLVPIWAARPL